MASTAIGHLLFSFNSGASAWCFEVLQEGYMGDDYIYPRDISRNLSGQILVVETEQPHREFRGNVLIRFDTTWETFNYGGVDYTLGAYDVLRTALVATDLQVRSPLDKALWSAQWANNWSPRTVYDSKGEYRIVPIHLVETS